MVSPGGTLIKLGGEDSKPPKPETDRTLTGRNVLLSTKLSASASSLYEASSSAQHGAQATIEGRFPVKDGA